jgi:hypothetical protein
MKCEKEMIIFTPKYDFLKVYFDYFIAKMVVKFLFEGSVNV